LQEFRKNLNYQRINPNQTNPKKPIKVERKKRKPRQEEEEEEDDEGMQV
jgi:hypothetical protein